MKPGITKSAWTAIAVTAGLLLSAPALRAATPVVKKAVVVFPLTPGEGVAAEIAQNATGSLRTRLNASGRYEVVSFHERSPLVQALVRSGAINKSDVDGPFDTALAADIAKQMEAPYALYGSVDEVASDEAAHGGNATVTLYWVTSADAKAKIAASGGSGADPMLPVDAVVRLAVDKAVGSALTQLISQDTPETSVVSGGTVTPGSLGAIPVKQVAKTKKKKNNLGMIIGGVALIAVIAGSGGGGGGGGGNPPGANPPPFPF